LLIVNLRCKNAAKIRFFTHACISGKIIYFSINIIFREDFIFKKYVIIREIRENGKKKKKNIERERD